MIGLELIMNRANLSILDVATELNITKSAVRGWLNSGKPISKTRLKELSDYFGLDQELFTELTEEKEMRINCKAQFSQTLGEKTIYMFNQPTSGSFSAYFHHVGKERDEDVLHRLINQKKRYPY